MKKLLAVSLILIFFASGICFAEPKPGELIPLDQIKNELIGEWTHHIPGVGSNAMYDTYNFYEDGSFIYFFYGDFLDIRESMEGYWEVNEETGHLVAYITAVTYRDSDDFFGPDPITGELYHVDPYSGELSWGPAETKTVRYDHKPILYIDWSISNLKMQYTDDKGISDFIGGARLKMLSPVNSLFRNEGSWFYRLFYMPQPRNAQEERIYELEDDKYDPFLKH